MASNPFRSSRLTTPNGHVLMVPMDHGISMGPLPGLVDPRPTMQAARDGGASCFVVHKGLVRHAESVAGSGVLLHLSASTDLAPEDPNAKRIIGTVEEAVRLGVDGVSVHVNLGSHTEARQLQEVGLVAAACQEWGMPLLTMVYPRGPKIPDPTDPAAIAHAARLGVELGADIVKVPYTGDAETFRAVVEGAAGIPVIIAGGSSQSEAAFLERVRGAKTAGALGVSVGRNVFGADDPGARMAQIRRIFDEGL